MNEIERIAHKVADILEQREDARMAKLAEAILNAPLTKTMLFGRRGITDKTEIFRDEIG